MCYVAIFDIAHRRHQLLCYTVLHHILVDRVVDGLQCLVRC